MQNSTTREMTKDRETKARHRDAKNPHRRLKEMPSRAFCAGMIITRPIRACLTADSVSLAQASCACASPLKLRRTRCGQSSFESSWNDRSVSLGIDYID
jgi:hypothetical protein